MAVMNFGGVEGSVVWAAERPSRFPKSPGGGPEVGLAPEVRVAPCDACGPTSPIEVRQDFHGCD